MPENLPSGVTPVQTIQLTSKRLKAYGCLSSLVFMLGVLLLVATTGTGPMSKAAVLVGGALAVVGLCCSIATSILVWWRHE